MRYFSLIVLMLAFAVTACGGGGEDTGVAVHPPESVEPVPEPEETPEEPEEPEGRCYETDRHTLESFLDDAFGGNRLVRWEKPPVLAIGAGASGEERRIVQTVVTKLNKSLPSRFHISMQAQGQLLISFVPTSEWDGACGASDGMGCADTEGYNSGELTSAHIYIRRFQDFGRAVSCEKMKSLVVAHELLHALGFRKHIPRYNRSWSDPPYHLSTVMHCNGGDNCDGGYPTCGVRGRQHLNTIEVPTTLDQDALRAMYSLDNGDYPEDLEYECGQ